MLKLYKAGNSICTQKVLITLAEKGLAYDTHDIDLFRNEQFSPEYLKINPKGVVPALDHDGRIVIESTLICEYLDDTFATPRLIPADPWARAQMRLWSKEVDEKLFAACRELSFSAMFREKMRSMSAEQREGRFRNVGDPAKRARFMSTYEQGVESPFVLEGIGAWEMAFTSMEKAVGKGGPWLQGQTMTLADVNMMPFVARLAYLDLLDLWLGERPGCRTWWDKAQHVASFRKAVPDLIPGPQMDAMRTFGGAIRQRVAERRAEYLALMAG